MARGKIQIKRIENSTNRQVTYSKRRNGLFKKANELSVLCDAKVSIILLSSSKKINYYISPGTSTKEIFDHYQKVLEIDLWSKHYQEMQENLKKFKEINKNLRRDIRQRIGDCLNYLSFNELCKLEEDVERAGSIVRETKYKVLSREIDNLKKKVKGKEVEHHGLKLDLEARGGDEDPYYGLVDNGDDYKYYLGFRGRAAARLLELQTLGLGPAALPSTVLTTYPLLG